MRELASFAGSIYDLRKHKRNGASFFRQALLCHNRSIIQQYRRIGSYFLERGVAMLAGGLMGLAVGAVDGELFRSMYNDSMVFLSPAPMVWLLPLLGLLVGMAVGLAGGPAGVKIFGEEKVVYWREAAAGHSRFAYYVGKSMSVVYRFVAAALHFTALFYFLAQPIIAFERAFGIILIEFYCVYGLAAIVSMLVRRENASLLAVVVCLFSATFNGFGPSLVQAKEWGVPFFWDLWYARWGSEALFTEEAMPRALIYNTTAAADLYGYTLDRFGFDMGMMSIIGTVYRIIAFVLLVFTHREKQK